MVITEEAAEVEVTVEPMTEDAAGTLRLESGQRRRIFSIWESTWTRRSPSSLPEDAKVRFLCLSLPRKKLANVQTVTGTLKGYDALMNLVLDDVDEVMRGMYSSIFPLMYETLLIEICR